jgi:hypothetical protein
MGGPGFGWGQKGGGISHCDDQKNNRNFFF